MDSYGLVKTLGKPPKYAEPAKPPISEEEFPKVQDRYTFYSAAENIDKVREYSEMMARNRLHYVRQIEKADRENCITEQTEERKDNIRRIMTRSDTVKWKTLLKDRHTWKKTISEYGSMCPRVCAFPMCSARPMDCSLFCFHHILVDPNQTLFLECKTCGRPYPRAGCCILCGNRN